MNGIYPPGLDGPLIYLVTVWALMLGALLALEWLWRLAWSLFERPAPLRAPLTAVRVILLVLIAAGLIRTVPRLWLFMRWPILSPVERELVAVLSAQAEVAAVLLFSLAWLVAQLGEPMVKYQLEKQPLPLHLWPTWEQMKRPAKIGVGVFAIAFALTYLR